MSRKVIFKIMHYPLRISSEFISRLKLLNVQVQCDSVLFKGSRRHVATCCARCLRFQVTQSGKETNRFERTLWQFWPIDLFCLLRVLRELNLNADESENDCDCLGQFQELLCHLKDLTLLLNDWKSMSVQILDAKCPLKEVNYFNSVFDANYETNTAIHL